MQLNQNAQAKTKSQRSVIFKNNSMWDPEFEKENPTDDEKATTIWGDPDVDPWTGRDKDDDSDE